MRKREAPRGHAGQVEEETQPPLQQNPALNKIRAELSGDDIAEACGYRVRSSSPVLAICRDLLDAGCFPWEPLEAWRGPVPCLRIRSIGEAAGLEVNAKGTGFQPYRAVRPAPPARFGGSPYDREAAAS